MYDRLSSCPVCGNQGLENFLIFDDLSYQNLEIEKNIRTGTAKGTLLSVIDKTMTAMGGRMLKQWTRYPLMDESEILERYQAVAEAKSQIPVITEIRGASECQRSFGIEIFFAGIARDRKTAFKISIDTFSDGCKFTPII